MRNLKFIRNTMIGSTLGALLLAAAFTASAQNANEEYREWQRAQARAEREHQDYLRTRRPNDYRQWQQAQRLAQQEYAEYQRATNRTGGYNTGYNNNNRNGQYRVNRNGSYYSTDARGAELLRTAVRNGYSQGYREGQMDRRRSRPFDYTMGTTYRNGTYGYQSYVARDQYQHYFQQGFQRGYEDGYNSTNRYGSRSGNGLTILGDVLNTILNLSNN